MVSRSRQQVLLMVRSMDFRVASLDGVGLCFGGLKIDGQRVPVTVTESSRGAAAAMRLHRWGTLERSIPSGL